MIYTGKDSYGKDLYEKVTSGVKKGNYLHIKQGNLNETLYNLEEIEKGNKARTELCRVRAIYRP